MKFFFGLILGSGMTALVLYKKPEPKVLAPDEMVTKFKELSENEARRYAEATTADEKLEAADALYGKMMLIFLANLSLKMQPIHQVDPVMVDQSFKEQIAPVVETSEIRETPVARLPDKVKEKLTPEARLLVAYKDSTHSTSLDRRTRRMLGVFEGTLRHTQGKDKGRIDGVRISMDFVQAKKDELDGSSSVVLTSPQGQEYSRGTSEGGNGSLRLHPDDEDIVFIDASPTSYILLSISKLRGNYVDQGKIIGNIQLHRK